VKLPGWPDSSGILVGPGGSDNLKLLPHSASMTLPPGEAREHGSRNNIAVQLENLPHIRQTIMKNRVICVIAGGAGEAGGPPSRPDNLTGPQACTLPGSVDPDRPH
jgi:hypothetical protein